MQSLSLEQQPKPDKSFSAREKRQILVLDSLLVEINTHREDKIESLGLDALFTRITTLFSSIYQAHPNWSEGEIVDDIYRKIPEEEINRLIEQDRKRLSSW